MDQHIKDLDDSRLITNCTGPWGSLLLLTPKPHQEGYTDADNSIWRVYVGYRPHNSITRSFVFPIPRRADSIEELEAFAVFYL